MNDPFVFASQVKQVYYTKDPNDDCHVVTNTTPRDLFDIYGDLENEDVGKHLDDQLRSLMFDQFTVNENENIWSRDDVPGTTVDASLTDDEETREEPRQESLDDWVHYLNCLCFLWMIILFLFKIIEYGVSRLKKLSEIPIGH